MPSFDYSTIEEWLLANVDKDIINTVAEHGISGSSIHGLSTKDDVLYFFEFYEEEIKSKAKEIFYATYKYCPEFDWLSVQAKQFYVGLVVKDAALRIFQEQKMIKDAQEREAAK